MGQKLLSCQLCSFKEEIEYDEEAKAVLEGRASTRSDVKHFYNEIEALENFEADEIKSSD